MLELEALSSGVMSKLRLWESLVGLSAVEARLDAAELTRLASEANDQLERLRRLHDMAARDAFT